MSETVAIVSPVYGCRACLEDLVDRIATVMVAHGKAFEVILVDDGSPDGAWERIVELSITRRWLRGLRLSRNFGQHNAISAGIENATGDVVVVMDCDLQDVPEEIPRLVQALDGHHQVAFAQRVRRQDAAMKRLTSWAFFRLLSWLTGVPQDHTTANFGAFSRRVIDSVNRMPESERCFPLMVKWTGFPTVLVPVHHVSRGEGSSGYSLVKLLRLALNIILSYSDRPLRLVVKLGLAFSFTAFLIVGLSVYRYSVGDIAVAGFTSIIASIWLLGGIIIFCVGVTGLYVGRLFSDTKGRPHYIVSEQVNVQGNAP